MASAKFLEEALSTDVDESAVNAIVGSLETQLVTSTPTVSNQQGPSVSVQQNHLNSAIANGGTVSTQKHGVSNGGSGSMNIVLSSDPNKTISASTFQGTNVVHSNVVNSVVASLQGSVVSSGYVNQTTSNSASQSNLSHLTKPHETVKLVYPAGNQTLGNPAGSVNVNNRVSFPIGSLPNGNLGLSPLSSQPVINAVTSSGNNQSVGIVSHINSQAGNNVTKHVGGLIGVESGKQTLVIKTSGNANVTQSLANVPMTISTSMTHVSTAVTSGLQNVVTLSKPITHTVGTQQTIVGGQTAILPVPANVQIVNVNAVRPATPGQPGQKTMAPRVVIGSPHMVGARPGQPGQITLQTLQGLQPGQQGHLLLKTENGQYQLLRVGPPPTTPGAGITQNTATAISGSSTFRLQTVPAVQNAVTVATTSAGTAINQQAQPAIQTTQNATAQRHPVDTTKEKCRKFLANLLELSSREPKAVERNVRTLIQELIDAKVEPEQFCDRLEKLLNASPQPCLIGFLKKSLPLLRQSLVTKELVIDGIRPPPHTVVFSQANSGTIVSQLQTQLRPQMTLPAPVRVMAPAQTLAPRLGQPIQRVVTPVIRPQTNATARIVTTTTLRPPGTINLVTTSPITTPTHTQIRVSNPSLPAPPLHVVRQPPLKTATPVHIRTPTTITRPAIVTKTSTFTKPPAPSLLPKPTSKEKEKKTFHSAGYTGDDDINDVAAMGGVNLAEETQRILGSTEFVGRHIRSCKDEIFLHSIPLQKKIRDIAARHGLDEPPSDVAALISHATQERLKNIVEKLAIIAEHRIDFNKADPRYEVTQDVKGQLKFLEELDRVEMKRHEEQERELLLRAAKSRSKSDDPEQAKLKAKAKEIQRAEMEEVRQREANLTALQAIGSRHKKAKLDNGGASSTGQPAAGGSGSGSGVNRTPIPLRPRVKRVNLRDLLFLLEQERETCRTALLYKSFLK